MKHTSAKIVVIVDTHCLENGQFVYKGNLKEPKSYEACYMRDVGAYGAYCRSSH